MEEKTEQIVTNSLSDLVAGVRVSTMLTGGSDLAGYGTIAYNNNYSLLTLNRIILTYLYTSSGIFQTAIDLPTQDALSRGIEIESDQMSSSDIDELLDFMEESGQWTALMNAWNWGRLYGGAGLIINTNQEAETPLNLAGLANSPLEIYDADRWQFDNAHPYAGDMDEMLFGKPNDFFYLYGQKIHNSRVIKIKGKRAPYYVRRQLRGWGMSEGERMIKDLNLYFKTQNVLYEILDESKIDVYRINGLAQKLANPAGTTAVTTRIHLANELKNYVNALIMDANDEYEQKSLTFSGLADISQENRIGICSALRFPITKLFGLSASGFNTGESDLENYNMMIEAETRTPMRQVIREMIMLNMYHLWGREAPFRFEFPPLRILSAEQEQNVKNAEQNRALALYDRGLLTSQELGEMLQKSGVITIETSMTKGLLPDQPQPPESSNPPSESKNPVPLSNSKKYILNKNYNFEESKHPRDEEGKFTEGGGEASGIDEDKSSGKTFTDYQSMIEYQKKEWLGKLSESEVKAVNGFTKGGYRYMRAFQAGDVKKLERFPEDIRNSVKKEVEDFQTALDADGKYEGTVYRGMNFASQQELNNFLGKKTFTMNADSSGTVDKGTAQSFSTQGKFELLMEIKSKTAVSIENLSSFRQEKELILRQGTQYAIKSKKTKKGVTVVQLIEL